MWNKSWKKKKTLHEKCIFIWLKIDSTLRTNDSKVCDSTHLSHDSTRTRRVCELWLDSWLDKYHSATLVLESLSLNVMHKSTYFAGLLHKLFKDAWDALAVPQAAWLEWDIRTKTKQAIWATVELCRPICTSIQCEENEFWQCQFTIQRIVKQ